jgi:hypothetical protein
MREAKKCEVGIRKHRADARSATRQAVATPRLQVVARVAGDTAVATAFEANCGSPVLSWRHARSSSVASTCVACGRATAFTRERYSLWDGRMARSVAQDCANATLERLRLSRVDLNDRVLLRTERPAGAVKGADLRVV